MVQYTIICLVALFGSCLTFFSGFGLGTLLVPVFALFFPIELAIALTAIVHFLNTIFKAFLVGRLADKDTVLRFGIPSLLASFAGAYVLLSISKVDPLFSYSLNDHFFSITILKLTIGLLLVFFALFDLVPALTSLHFDKKYLMLGGLLSGFFGGLSGNQGALRSAFLVKAGLSKEAYIATGVVIALLVDVSRLAVYSDSMIQTRDLHYGIIAAATGSAFAGAFIGSKLVKKITIKTLQYVVGITLIFFGLFLSCGII